MQEIEVGEYVRTKKGIIDKVVINYYGICNSKNCNCKHVSCQKDYYDEEDIVKHSKNIIDLIEVGDYVNKEKVLDIFNPMFLEFGKLPYIVTKDKNYEGFEIKSIVTKQQFESIEYKI